MANTLNRMLNLSYISVLVLKSAEIEMQRIIPAGFESDDEYDDYGNYIEKQTFPLASQVEDFHIILQNACIQNNVPEIERALNSGSVDVNSYLSDSWTALMYAAFNGSFDAVKYLLQNGADPLINYDSHNVVMCVCDCKKVCNEIDLLHCLKLVANFDSIDINVKNRAGVSALMYACSSGWQKIVEFLIDHGADIELKDNENGATPLFFAVRFNRVNVVKFLLSHNANKDIINKRGETVFTIAESKNMVDILCLLDSNYNTQSEVYYSEECTYWDKVKAEIENGYPNDVQEFLETLSMENYLAYFNSNNITFKKLLTGNNNPTVKMGILLTPHRIILASALKYFHTLSWSDRSLAIDKYKMNAENIAQTLATIVRQLHILDASIMYLETYSDNLDPQKYQEARAYLKNIRGTSDSIFNVLEKKTKISSADYMGSRKLKSRIKKRSLDALKVFAVSVVIVILWRKF